MELRSTGIRIRRLRERAAWTQEHLAQAARISARTVQRAEEGTFSTETLSAIAGALDIEVDELTAPRGRHPDWPRIATKLFYEDAGRAADWLEAAFGFRSRLRAPGPDGKLIHAELEYDDGLIMVGPAGAHPSWRSPRQQGGMNTQNVLLYVEDLEAHLARARAAGATIVSELRDGYYYSRIYEALDLEGHLWAFAEYLPPARKR